MELRTHFQKIAIAGISFFILTFGSYVSSYAANYYVDNAANGANSGLSWKDAWVSFADINWSKINPGDTVYVSGGSSSKTYNETLYVRKSGTSGRVITIKGSDEANHDGSVIIDAQATRRYCVDNSAGYDYVTIQNFTCNNFDSNGARVHNGDYVTIDKMVFNWYSGDVAGGQVAGVRFQYCTNSVISNNIFDTQGNDTDQTDGIFVQYSTNITVSGNSVQIRSECADKERCHNDCYQFNDSKDVTIKNNYCEQANTCPITDRQGIYSTESYGTWWIYGNVLDVPCGKQDIAIRLPKADSTYYIYNNTIWGGRGNQGRLVWLNAEDGVTIDVHYKNNICYTNSDEICIDISENGGKVNLYADYNITYCPSNSNCWDGGSFSAWKARGYDANGGNGNPNLDSNHRPQSSSTNVVDRGTNLGASFDQGLVASTVKGDWVPVVLIDRDSCAPWDIGAYEYAASYSTLDKPEPPKNLRVMR